MRIANDSKYGLQGGVFSGSLERSLAVARRIRTGGIGINGGAPYGPDLPFGGYKHSGIGRQNGLPGFEQYLEIKSIAWPAADAAGGPDVTVTSEPEVYYDPYDFEIDADPYPVWKRLRDEAPLYRNEKYEFFALSRWDDVDAAMLDWKTYISGRGSVLEIIKAGVEIPPGRSSSRTRRPTTSTVACSRGSSRRRRCRRSSPRCGPTAPRCSTRWSGRAASTSSRTWASSCPCGSIGMLLGIPEQDQEAIREQHRRRPAARGRASRTRPSTTASAQRGCSPTTSPGGPSTPPTTS